MDKTQAILAYLEVLTVKFVNFNVHQQYHILILGSAFMLFQGQHRSTDDIDFVTIAPERSPKLSRIFATTVQRRGEVATRRSEAYSPGPASY